jgi:hypothetical protein
MEIRFGQRRTAVRLYGMPEIKIPGGDNSGHHQIFVYLKGNCKVQMYTLIFLKATPFQKER